MKRKSLIIGSIFMLTATFSLMFFHACSKDELKNNNNKTEIIYSFNNENDYRKTLNNLLSMSSEELKNYEESKGYKSYGRMCDELYQSINPEDFTSIEEIKAYVAEHSDFLQLVEDENGEFILETLFSNNPNRYLINENRMFSINKSIYKVFKEGIVVGQSERTNIIKEINSDNVSKYIDNINIYFMPVRTEYINKSLLKDADYNCGTSDSKTSTTNVDRTIITISLIYWDTYDVNGEKMTLLQNSVLVKAQKKSLFWFNCKRTISCSINIVTDYEINNEWQRECITHNYQGTSPEFNYQLIISGGVYSLGKWVTPVMHYGAYYCWGDTPSTNPAILQCNTDLFRYVICETY